jgi:hypothetical protein
MYQRIIDNLRSRLQMPRESIQPQIEVEPQHPIEEDDGHLSPQPEDLPLQQNDHHLSAHSSEHQEEEQNESDEYFNNNFEINSFSPIKVYSNKQIEVYIEKALHQRHKRFRLQDFLYNIKIKVKPLATQPLLIDLLNVLEKTFVFILNNLRTHFNEEDPHIVYLDLMQSPMINALNSGGFLLSDKSNEIVDRILGILFQYLNSDQNLDLELNDTFKVYLNVLSVDHVNYQRQSNRNPQTNRRKKHYGSAKNGKKKMTKDAWAIDVPDGYEYHPNAFKNKCLLICIILGLLQNAYFKSDRVDTRYFYASGISYSNKKKQNYAGNILRNELQKMICELSLDQNGPYEFAETAEKISAYYNCQIFVFGGMENCSKLKYVVPSQVNDELQPVYLYEPYNEENHVKFIKNIQSYFRINNKICFQCFKSFKSHRYLHRCYRL